MTYPSATRSISSLLLIIFLLTACTGSNPGGGEPMPEIEWNSRFLYEKNLSWASRRGLTSEQFSDWFDVYRDRGYIIVDVDARTAGNSARYAMVWHENVDGRGWAEHRNLTSDRYHELWEQYRDRGYRPLDVEGYLLDGNVRFAGIWIENKEGLAWWSRRGMTSSEYADHFEEQRAAGKRPIDIEVYQTNSGLRVAAIWYENVDGLAWTQLRNMDRTRYQEEVDEHAADGHIMIDYESYEGSNNQLYAAIWEQKANLPASTIRTNRSALGYANYWRQYRDEGFRIADFENYNTDDNPLYGGIWIENNDRYRYGKKGDLNTAIQDFQNDNSIPGISVAVRHNGSLVYRRGFGDADKNGPKVAHGQTVYGLASISKVIGGTLAAKLEDEGALRDGTSVSLDLDDPTSDYLPNIPNQHTHVVRELTSHLGCVAHYPSATTPGIPNQTTHYSTALAAAQNIWGTGLVNNCNIGQLRSYSTPASTLLGAVLEQATGRPITQLLEEELFEPYGLGNIRVQWATNSLPSNYERAVPYQSNGNATSYGDNSWKVLGGGIEADAVVLARFGQLVLNGTIVDANTRDNRLWTPADPNCANPGGGTCRYGVSWSLGSQGGRRIAEHGGSWTGARSHLRIYPDDNLVITILTNQTGHDPSTLATTIAGIVLNP